MYKSLSISVPHAVIKEAHFYENDISEHREVVKTYTYRMALMVLCVEVSCIVMMVLCVEVSCIVIIHP